MIINNNDIKLVIFDLDGTLLDSLNIWSDIDRNFFAKRNMDVPNNYHYEIAHLGLKNAAIFTKEKYLPNEDADAIFNEWKSAVIEKYHHEIQLIPYADKLLELLVSKGVKLVGATANSRELYEPCLSRLNIFKYFDKVYDVDTTNYDKKSGKIFDLISEDYDIYKKNILVVDDLIEVLTNAYNKGYKVIGALNKNNINEKDNHPFSINTIENYYHIFLK